MGDEKASAVVALPQPRRTTVVTPISSPRRRAVLSTRHHVLNAIAKEDHRHRADFLSPYSRGLRRPPSSMQLCEQLDLKVKPTSFFDSLPMQYMNLGL